MFDGVLVFNANGSKALSHLNTRLRMIEKDTWTVPETSLFFSYFRDLNGRLVISSKLD